MISTIAAILVIAMLTCSLAACDLFGGGDKDKKPVKTYDNPYDFFQALSVAKDWTIIGYLSDEPEITSVNSKGEYNIGNTIAKYVGNDLWIWNMNFYKDDIWEKAKVSENNFEYVEELNYLSEFWVGSFDEYTKDDFVKQGDYWYEKEDGVIYERIFYTLDKNILTMWGIDENGEKTKGGEYILEANITLPDAAKNAETITEEEMFGYDNPLEFFNALVTAQDWTMRMYDQYGSEERRVSASAKGEILYYEVGNTNIVSKFIDNQLWLFVRDMDTNETYKAKIDPKSKDYLELKTVVVEMVKDGLDFWLRDVEFVKDGEYWYEKVNGEIQRRQWFEPRGNEIMLYQEYEGKIIQDESYELRANIEAPGLAGSAKEISAEEIFAMVY